MSTMLTRLSLRSRFVTSPIRLPTHRQWLRLTHCHRPSSTATPTRGTQRSREFAYPESINVYVSPAGQTALYGIMRVCTTGVFLTGTFVLGMGVYFNPDASNWWIPACIVGSAIPAAMALLVGPYMTSIRVLLPTSARRSQDSLRHFMTAVPPSTIATFTFLRFAPWPLKRSIFFSDLRRLPAPRWGGTQLEYIPLDRKERMQTESGIRGWFVRKYFCEYWINSASNRMGGLPAWNMMAEQIPLKAAHSSLARTLSVDASSASKAKTTPAIQSAKPAVSATPSQRAPPPLSKAKKR